MKRIIWIVILLIGMGNVWAQMPQKYTERLDSIITDLVSGRQSKYVFHYDAEGRLAEMIVHQKREGKWTEPEQRLYTYDEQGRTTCVTTKSLEDWRNITPFRERAEYDDKGRISLWTYELYDKNRDSWYESVHSGSRRYEYDAQGNQIVTTFGSTIFTNGKFRERLRHEKEYDKKGRLVKQRDYEFANDEQRLWHTFSYTYDKQGRLVETKRICSDYYDKKADPDMTIKKTYDKEGRITSVSNDWGERNCSRDEYYYDTRGNLIQIATFYPFEGRWEHEKNMVFTYDMDTPVSSVMGLSCPEVLSTDYALKNRLNLTCKPLSVYANEGDDPRYHEETTYFYSPIDEPILPTALSEMDSVKRYDYLVKCSREVIKHFGPGYYREFQKPEVSGLHVLSDTIHSYPELNRNLGRKYYTVIYPYDHSQEQLEWNYAAKVEIWDDGGEPKGALFGHGLGIHFGFGPYREWVKKGIQEDTIMPYEHYTIKPERIGCE